MTLVMDAEIKAELVKRLRSGNYIQGQEKLATIGDEGERYCCLGVLCEIAVERGIIKRFDQEVECWDCDHLDHMVHKVEVHYDHTYDATLPDKVVEWAGMESVDVDERPEVSRFDDYEGMGRFEREHPDKVTSLAEMNDTGVPFIEIAQFIEDNVEAR